MQLLTSGGGVISSDTIKREQKIIDSFSTSEDHAVDFINYERIYKTLNDKFHVAKVRSYKEIHGVA